MGGLVWQVASDLAKHGFLLKAIQVYSGYESEEMEPKLAATTAHMDGREQHEKAEFRFPGELAFSLRGKKDLHSFDCKSTPRLFHGTREALCNQEVYHQGRKQEGKLSVVIQIINKELGKVTEDECKLMLKVLEDHALSAYQSGVYYPVIRAVQQFLHPSVAYNGNAEREGRRSELATELLEAFKCQDGATNLPPCPSDLVKIERLIPAMKKSCSRSRSKRSNK